MPAQIGDNLTSQDATEFLIDRLEQDFDELLASARQALAEAAALPAEVNGSDDVSVIGSAVVKLRDLSARGKAQRAAEKEPHMRAADAVYAFFSNRIIEPIDACRTELQRRIDAYKQRQLAEERRRREAEALAARKAQQEAERLRAEAEAATRRARSEEGARLREEEARAKRVEADMANAAAEQTTLATMQKAGKIVGERFEGERSGKVTMRRTPVALIEDIEQIDLNLLRPFLKPEAIEQALRAWAKATGYQQKMPGAIVTIRESTVVL